MTSRLEGHPHFKSIDLTDPATMERMLRSGAVWTLSRTFWQDAVDAINKGLVPLSACKNVPPEVMPAIRAQ